MSKKKGIKVVCIILCPILLVLGGLTYSDIQKSSSHKKAADRPPKDKPLKIDVNNILYELDNGCTDIDWSRLDDTLTYIDNRYDCADFRMQHLIRILYKHKQSIPEDTFEKIKKTVLGFKYWMDEPGDDSMCYWSENHQMLFATSEYLIGQMFPDEIFTNNSMTGREHMEKARVRILDWLEMRWNYGFTEYYSNVYYNEDIAPMANLIDYCNDKEITKKTTIIMDLLIYDIASQSYNGAFVSVSGRAYEHNRKGGAVSSGRSLTNYLFGDNEGEHSRGMSYCFTSSNGYTPPEVLIDIGHDTSEVVIKASNGLNISELKDEGYYGSDERSIMMQWGMEAFSNHGIIRNTLDYMRRNEMFTNRFINPLSMMDVRIMDWLHLDTLASKIINPQTNGVAIQRGNTYTYKNESYSMYTTQSYFPGDYGDQQHVQGVNVDNTISIFHCHPAVDIDDKGPNGNSPLYWVSYGHLPDAVQDKNVQLAIYNIPKKKGLMESKVLDYTHLYFAVDKFDEYVLDGRYAFAKLGDTYVAVIAYNDLYFRDGYQDDLIQDGKKSFYITHMATEKEYTTLNDFIEYIKTNKVTFDEKKLILTYTTSEEVGCNYELKFNDYFKVDSQVIDTNYIRYDSPYIKAKQKDKGLTFNYNGKSLHLDYYNMIREVTNR